MASANTPHSSFSARSPRFSSIVKQVYLENWWLIKTEPGPDGKQLGVGGFALIEGQDERLFYSAAIIKRDLDGTLHAVDGITILLGGLINRGRTFQNGFSSEICNQFFIGFPYSWEDFAALSFEESTNEEPVFTVSHFSRSLKALLDGTSRSSVPFDDLPVHYIRGILTTALGDSESDQLRKSIWGFYRNSANDDTPSQSEKAKADEKLEKSSHRLDVNSEREEFQNVTPINSSGTGTASIIGETPSQVRSKGLKTRGQLKKTTANLGKEDENQVQNVESGKQVLHKSGACSDMYGSTLTRAKASVARVGQRQCVTEFGCGGPQTRSKARKMK